MSWVCLAFQNVRLGSIIRVQLEARTKISTRLRYLLKRKIGGVREQIDVVFASASSHPNWNSEKLWKKKKQKNCSYLRSILKIDFELEERRQRKRAKERRDAANVSLERAFIVLGVTNKPQVPSVPPSNHQGSFSP